jgi:lipoprotein-anchoring transpeptidase ErfK/SrfK
VRRALFWSPLLLVLVGCGAAAHVASSTRPPSDTPNCRADVVRRAGSANVAVAAVVRSASAKAYRRPGAKPFARFGRLNVNGFPTFFRVLGTVRGPDCSPRWFRVQLPIKPNGVTGYIRAKTVETGRVRSRVVVDVSAKRLTLFRSGRRVFTTSVAVGSPATPTPTGRYYVNQRLIPQDPGGPFGPAAIGISAYSTVLTGWTQGGPIAIHGTNAPWSIGEAVSNGCIRLPNAVLRRVFRQALNGTPVVIRS